MKNTFLKLASVLICIATLLSFAACTKGTPDETTAETTEAKKLIDIDLTSYTIVRPVDLSDNVLPSVVAFRKTLNGIIDGKISIEDDWLKNGETDAIRQKLEILVGNTTRSASSEALEGVDDPTAFVIKITDTKIVINSKTDAGLENGLTYFLTLVGSKTLTIEENYLYVSEGVPVIDIVKDGKTEYSVVFSDGLDNISNSSSEYDRLDLEVEYSKQIKDKIKNMTGVTVSLGTDWTKPGADNSDKKEILVGSTNRPESAEFISKLGPDGYGYAVIGNKIVVAGSNLTTLELAYKDFISYISSVGSVNSSGKKDITVVATLYSIKHADQWYIDIPEFENGTLAGYSDTGDGCLEYLYKETNEAAFTAYCSKLEAAGYKLHNSNENPGIIARGYKTSKALVYLYYSINEKQVRIITSSAGSNNFQPYPTAESVPSYTKVTESKLTQMAFNYTAGNFGNCYVVTLADGSFVVMDGGGYNAEYGDVERLYNLLKSLNKRTDGKIVIAGYILSHAHWDHYRNFYNFVLNYSSSIKIEAFYVNIASDNELYNGWNTDYGFRSCFNTMSSKLGGVPMVKVHTGMKFYIRNAEFEILYTQEDIFPERIDYFNETSTVLRMTIDGTTAMFNGDAKNYASKYMLKRYGNYLKSDICTVAHHGYDGMTQSYYIKVDPTLILWPTGKTNVATLKTGNSYAVDKYIWDKYGADNIIIAEPTQTITFPYAAGQKPVTEAY